MQASQPSLFARDHTILGVCEGLGEDFGFNPVYLRIAFALPLLVNPVAVIGAYLGAGAIVFVSRLLSPNPRPAVRPEPVATEAVPVADGQDQYPLPIAA